MMSDSKYDPPNMDLIRLVQQARLQHDRDAKPSDVSAVYWLEFKSDSAPPPTPHAGQWVIEIPADQADTIWESVKSATQRGDLGYKSKLATISRTGKPTLQTLAIRTYDSQDAEDVARVRAGLSALGIVGDWVYEPD
jgi:hypothetical protein